MLWVAASTAQLVHGQLWWTFLSCTKNSLQSDSFNINLEKSFQSPCLIVQEEGFWALNICGMASLIFKYTLAAYHMNWTRRYNGTADPTYTCKRHKIRSLQLWDCCPMRIKFILMAVLSLSFFVLKLDCQIHHHQLSAIWFSMIL